MRQIATELDCSSTTAYRYFKNKEEILVAVRASAFNRFCGVIEDATRSSPDPRKAARNVGQAYLDFALEHPDAYRMMFDISQADVTGHAELTEALARAGRSMVAYVAPLIHEGIFRGDTQALGQMLWAAAHGLVMLRLSGIVTDDTELRQLHETTMSALVRGAHEMAPARRGTGALELMNPAPVRKAKRRTP